jgi:myo-inositol-1(or 4)-monophosphatase
MDPLAIAILAAQEAGHVLEEHYGRPHDVSVKGPRDILTEADLAAELVTMGVIRSHMPESHIVSEETSQSLPADDGVPVWYVDPLDGTTNYARGYPIFSVSVAMALRGEVQCGAVYQPLVGHLFAASRGQGATLNGRRLHVSERSELMDAMVLMDWPREGQMRDRAARFLHVLSSRVDAIRSGGSAAVSLCQIAAGWADVYYQFTLSPWDVAAGVLIAEEAGARVTDLSGRPTLLTGRDWLVTNGKLHDAVLTLDPWA